jgi:hypothetical protein
MVLAPRLGFRTTDLKVAFYDGNYVHPSVLPSPVSRSLGYATIDALTGLARLEGEGDGKGSPAPLHISSVQLGSAEFETDRGRKTLPAWLHHLEEVDHPIAVLAVERQEIFEHPKPSPHQRAQFAARSGQDDLTIEVGFVGGPPETMSYGVEVVEARHAVAIQVLTLSSTMPPGPVALVGYQRTVNARLDAPVGERVLVDPRNWAPAPLLPVPPMGL